MKRWGDWLIDSSLTRRNEGTWHTHKTGQKNYWRIRICVLHFFLFKQLSLSLSSNFLFQQCHCQTSNNFFPFSIYFGNAIATNQLQQKKFFPPILAMLLPQIHFHNFFYPLFRHCHCHKSMTTFFFFWEMICPHHFYNIFIANPKWHVVTGCYCWIKKVILVLNSNLN